MPSVASVADFIDALHASQILEQSQLDEVIRDLQPRYDDLRALADALVERGWLTPYQVQHVMTGRGHELVIGPYRVLDLLGEGGMGQVFKAMHQRLHRLVALKVIRRERLSADPEIVRRFQREAQLAAQMSHPNVVIVFDSDEVDDRHFIAMEYVEGIDLSKLVRDRGPLPIKHACEFIRQSALGLQHAHERGLVHRDIKPSNLFVTRIGSKGGNPDLPQDEKAIFASESVVKILDMGLARLTESTGKDASFQTQAGTVMGTPDFIAPEQARNASSVDHRADLYSLGCTFYFLLTGKPPFPEGSVVEKLLMHQLDDAAPVEELRPNVPERVLAIVKRLMAKRPADRFQTAQEVVDELAKLALSDSGGAAARSGTPADSSAALARPGAPADSGVAMGGRLAAPERSSDATAVVQVTPVPAKPPKEKVSDVPDPAKLVYTFKGHRGWVISAAFSPDRNLLASGGVDGSIRLWGFSSSVPKEQVLPQVHEGEVQTLIFSPNNQLLASGSGALDGIIWLWDLSDKHHPRHKCAFRGHRAGVTALDFSADNKLLASASQDRTVRLWDTTGEHAEERATLRHPEPVHAVKFSPDGKFVATGSKDGSVRLWSIGKIWSSEIALFRGHTGAVQTIALSPNGRFLASGSLDETIRLWDLTNGQTVLVLKGQDDVIRHVLFTPDGASLMSVGNRSRVVLWNIATGEQTKDWPFRLVAGSIAFTFDGRYMAAGRTDGSVEVFRLYPRRQESGEQKST